MSTPGNQEQYGQGQYGQGQYGQGQYGQEQYGQGQYGQQPPYQGQPAYGQQRPTGGDDRFWASAAHWGALVVWLVTSGVLAFVAPLVIMQTKGQSSPVVRRQAVESLNFQLSMLLYALGTGLVALVGAVLSFILVGIPILVVALLVLLAVVVVSFVMPIIAALKVNNGEDYAYPFTLRLVS